MNRYFASLLAVIYVAMSVVVHAAPHLALPDVEQTDRNLASVVCLDNAGSLNQACVDLVENSSHCESTHCTFHFVFLGQTTTACAYDVGISHSKPAEKLLVALLLPSEKKPPRVVS